MILTEYSVISWDTSFQEDWRYHYLISKEINKKFIIEELYIID